MRTPICEKHDVDMVQWDGDWICQKCEDEKATTPEGWEVKEWIK